MVKALEACFCEVGRRHRGICRPGFGRDYVERRAAAVVVLSRHVGSRIDV